MAVSIYSKSNRKLYVNITDTPPLVSGEYAVSDCFSDGINCYLEFDLEGGHKGTVVTPAPCPCSSLLRGRQTRDEIAKKLLESLDLKNTNIFSTPRWPEIQPGTMSTTMPNPIGMMGGKMREIIIDRNQQPWKNYIPYIDADIPIELDCKQLLEIFKKENARILASNPYPDILYPCENMSPGDSTKVTVKNLWDGRKAYSKEFIFTLDANGNCICEEVKSGGGGGTKPGRRAKDMEMSSVEDMWNYGVYGDVINRTGSDIDKPSCEHLKEYFIDVNRRRRARGLDPFYPCESFKNGETEQYITYKSRRGARPVYYRFYVDANGNCQCEIVNKIPTDYTDRGSGPTDLGSGEFGDPTNLGGASIRNNGVMSSLLEKNYTFDILNAKFSSSPVFSTFTNLLAQSNLQNDLQPVISNSTQDFSQYSPEKSKKQVQSAFESDLNLSQPKAVDLTQYTNLNLDISSLITNPISYQNSDMNYNQMNLTYNRSIDTDNLLNRELDIIKNNELVTKLDTNDFTSGEYRQAEFLETNVLHPTNDYGNNSSEYSTIIIETSIPSITNSFTSIQSYENTFSYKNATSNLPTNVFHNKY